MSVTTARELLVDELKDIYSAEKQAVRAYPRLTKAANSGELREAMQEHLEQTQAQVERLERVFERLDARASGRTCEGMRGLLEEAATQAQQIEGGPVRDAALIGALQRIEHYEIAAYGTAASMASLMGEPEIKDLLGQSLQEEKDADEKLTQVAESVNRDALAAGEGMEEEAEEEEQPASRSRRRRAA